MLDLVSPDATEPAVDRINRMTREAHLRAKAAGKRKRKGWK